MVCCLTVLIKNQLQSSPEGRWGNGGRGGWGGGGGVGGCSKLFYFSLNQDDNEVKEVLGIIRYYSMDI